MASKNTIVGHTEREAFTDLERLDSLKAIDPVPAALQVVAQAQRLEGAREHAYADAQHSASDPHLRRTAAHRIAEARADLVQAQEASAQAMRDLAAAQATAFARVAPIIRCEYQRVLETKLSPALQAVQRVCDELIAIETMASRYSFHAGASAAPIRSPLRGETGDRIRDVVRHWLSTLLPWHTSSAA